MIGQLGTLVYGILLRHILLPSVMGLFDFVAVVVGFATNFDPGISAAAGIRLPQLEGKGDTDAVVKLRSTALWAEFIQGLVMALGIVVFVLVGGMSGPMSTSALVAAVIVVLYCLQDSLATIHQGHQSYVALSGALAGSSILGAILLPGGAWLGGIHGLLVAAIAYWVSQVALLYWTAGRSGIEIGRRLRRSEVRSLLALGLPLRVVDLPQVLVGSLDLLFVTSLLGIKDLAIYSFARIVFLQVTMVPGPLGNVFIMRAFRQVGADVPRAEVAHDARRFLTFEYLVVLPVVICLAVQGLNLLTATILPAYAPSRGVLNILAFSAFFVPQTTIIRNFWMLDRRFLKLGISNLVALGAHFAALGLAIAIGGLSLHAIAVGTLAGWMGYYAWIMATAGRELFGAAVALRVALSALVGAGTGGIIVALLPATGHGPAAVLDAALYAAISLIALLPLAAWGMHSTGVWRQIRSRTLAG